MTKVYVCLAAALLQIGSIFSPAYAQAIDHSKMDHSAHADMTNDDFDTLRERVISYRNFSNAEIMQNMMFMPPTYERYISDASISGDVGVIVLAHGAGEPGDTYFSRALSGLAKDYPVSIGFGMAMMNGNHIQIAIDKLESAGVKSIVVVPAAVSATGTVYEQWAYYLGKRAEAAYLSAPRVSSNVPISLGKPMTDHPMASEMLFDHAIEISNKPDNELLIIIGHGPSEAQDNAIDLKQMAKHVDRIKEKGVFSDVKGHNLQDDAPEPYRSNNVKTIRGWIEEAVAEGKRVVMVGYLLSTRGIQHKIPEDFHGLSFTFNEKGLSVHPDFTKWIETSVREFTHNM